MKPPCLSGRPAFPIDYPAPSYDSATFGLDLALLDKVDASECAVLEEGLFRCGFDKGPVVINKHV